MLSDPNLAIPTMFIDTSILIHDFMYRNPEVAKVRNVVPAQAQALENYRALIHSQLEVLASRGEVVHTTSAVLWRLAALFTDWYIPPAMARTEIQYLLSNYQVHDLPYSALEEAIAKMGTTPTIGVEETGWILLGDRLKIMTLFTCQNRLADEWPAWKIIKPETFSEYL